MRLLLTTLLLLATLAAAQGKKTLSLAVFGEESTRFKAIKPLRAKLANSLAKMGNYRVTDRSEAILKSLRKDFEYLPGSYMNDEDARQMNDQYDYNSQYICIVESTDMGDGYFSLNAKLISADEGEPSIMATAQSKLLNQQDVNRAGDELVNQLLELGGGIFIDHSHKMNKLSQDFAKTLKNKIKFKEGYCGVNGIKVQINTTEPVCNATSSAVSCTIEATLDGFSCTNDGEVHLKASVTATDRTEAAAINVTKKELLSGKADFLNEWSLELVPWKNK
jgi:hypothetical protein